MGFLSLGLLSLVAFAFGAFVSWGFCLWSFYPWGLDKNPRGGVTPSPPSQTEPFWLFAPNIWETFWNGSKMKKKCNFFSSYSENLSKIDLILSTKVTITRKIKIGNMIFLSFQHIPHLWCKFDHFWWKKNLSIEINIQSVDIFLFFGGRVRPPHPPPGPRML